jgi:hypothetical protein
MRLRIDFFLQGVEKCLLGFFPEEFSMNFGGFLRDISPLPFKDDVPSRL